MKKIIATFLITTSIVSVTSTAVSAGSYICVVSCASGSAGTNNSGQIQIKVSAPDRSAGTKYVRDNATKICRKAGYSRAGYDSWNGSYCKY